ncbi:hypothetical protein ACHWQZ_G010254 [Mnemiopsis leidyi]
MRRTLCIQLLALLAIQFLHFTDGKAFEESENEVLSLEKRAEDLVDEDFLEKRETEDQENEVEDEEEVEKREPEEEYYEEEVEKREPAEEYYEEEVEKREPEEEYYEEEVEKREPEEDYEEEMEKREPEEEDYEEEEMEKREPEDEALYLDNEIEVEKREDDSEEAVAEEKREDAEQSAASENTVVEDLDARSIQASFTLVDYRGRIVSSGRQGLLLYRGGTVCDDGFTWNSAHAICRTMGFTRAVRYRSGLVYGSFQSRKPIRLDDVICSSTHWASCRATSHHNCVHREDILLTCTGTGFQLVNQHGSVITSRTEGLLTYRQGTVCDDYFNYSAAHAICRLMGFSYAAGWRHGQLYGSQQTRRRITMDDVRCRYSYWNYCSYRTSHNCRHYEDVFLTCQPRTTHRPRFTLVDWQGHTAARGCEGLLLYAGGTVCDDYFNSNSAHAICKLLGYPRGALRYRNGHAYGSLQSRKRITMDDVRCTSSTWSSCHYNTHHNCGHHEDVLLTCRP